MNLFTKQKQTQSCRKQTYGYQRGKVGGGDRNWEFGVNRYTLLYVEKINNKDLCIAQGTIFSVL